MRIALETVHSHWQHTLGAVQVQQGQDVSEELIDSIFAPLPADEEWVPHNT